MKKPDGYDSAEAKQGGVFRNPEAGGYILGIVNTDMRKTKDEGRDMLVLSLDIADGEFKYFYRELSLKLSKDCYLKNYLVCEGDNVPFFKGAITAIEHSNPGFVFNFDEKTLIKKLVGANLREEDYINKNNEVKSILKIAYLCGVESVRKGLPILEPKKLTDTKKPAGEPLPPEPMAQDNLPF